MPSDLHHCRDSGAAYQFHADEHGLPVCSCGGLRVDSADADDAAQPPPALPASPEASAVPSGEPHPVHASQPGPAL